jgi:5-methylcytosine-specific restriction enzyme subunit McrC
MNSQNKIITITEYGKIAVEKDDKTENLNYKYISQRAFNAIKELVLSYKNEDTELLSLSSRKNIGEILTAKNYVGVITTKDGTTVEILPKISKKNIDNKDECDKVKKIFFKMLKIVYNINSKTSNLSKLDTTRSNLLEIFIKMFLDEVNILAKQGLKSAYVPVQENERFVKGKLLFPQNIKYNSVLKHRFFVQYDNFSINRPENKLIKSVLNFITTISKDSRNRQNALKLLSFFSGVDLSVNYEKDFSLCKNGRSVNHYKNALNWCKIFLKRESFTSFSGKDIAFALLFPMEKVFESYVATMFRKYIGEDVKIKTQDKSYYLFTNPKKFLLKPDIVLSKKGCNPIVIDTKWKLLNSDSDKNYGISQADMYQMYAYGKKYGAEKVVLIYPKIEDINETITYSSDDGVKVEVEFIDLLRMEESVIELIKKIKPEIKNEI